MCSSDLIDSQGHRGEMVHAFCRARKSRRIYAVKGQANDPRGSKLIWPKTPSRTRNSGDRLYLVGVDTAKRRAQIVLQALVWPIGITATQKAAALASLETLGIVARTGV